MKSEYLSNSLYIPEIIYDFHLFYTKIFNVDIITIKFMNLIA